MTYSLSKIRHFIVFSLLNQQAPTRVKNFLVHICMLMQNKHVHLQYLAFLQQIQSYWLTGGNHSVFSDVIWHSACTVNALPETSWDRESCIFHTLCHSWEHSSNLTYQPHICQGTESDRGSYRVIWWGFFFFLSCAQTCACPLVSAVPDYTPRRGNNCFHVLSSLSASCVHFSFFFIIVNHCQVSAAHSWTVPCLNKWPSALTHYAFFATIRQTFLVPTCLVLTCQKYEGLMRAPGIRVSEGQCSVVRTV